MPATDRRAPTRRSAQCTGFRWKTTPSAHPIAIPANMAKRSVSNMRVRLYPFTVRKTAVAARFTSDAGRSTFQPNAISWS